MGSTAEPVTAYKVKTIDFFKRKVPVVTQNENGPCPLLALANVLLLRNHIRLPPNTPEVQQDRLVSLVAEYVLDANNEKRLGDAGEEYKANIQRNIADALALLPKLATGVDVNVRFDHIQAFEFTQDTAIFDLLDVRLVHGWLIDPQDVAAKEAIAQQSYNELVSLLVNILGDDTPPHLLTPTAMAAHSREASFSSRRSSQLQAGTPRVLATQSKGEQPPAPPVDGAGIVSRLEALGLEGAEDAQELKQALELSLDTSSISTGATSEPTGVKAAGEEATPGSAARESTKGAEPATLQPASRLPGAAGSGVSLEEGQQRAERSNAQQQEGDWEKSSYIQRSIGALPEVADDEEQFRNPFGGSATTGDHAADSTDASAEAGSGRTGEYSRDVEKAPEGGAQSTAEGSTHGVAAVQGAAADAAGASSSGTHNPVPIDHRGANNPVPQYDDAALAKGKMPAFVDIDPDSFRNQQEGQPAASLGSSPPGAAEGSKWRQQSEERSRGLQRATVVQDFLEGTSSQLTEHGLLSLHQGLRPNELAILFRNNHFNTVFSHDNALWILVTDQGYLFEQSVVWERLCDVSGNTEFAAADFGRFTGQPATRDVAAAADLAQAAFASVVPPKGLPALGLNADPDADMALAIQLQEEEVERQQRFAAQQQAQPPQRASAGQRVNAGQSPQGRGGPPRAPVSGGRGGRPGQGKKTKDSKCVLM